MLQRMSDQNRIQFTEKPDVKVTPDPDSPNCNVGGDAFIEDQKAKKLNNSEVINSVRSANSVLSAGGGSIKDEGGPRKYIGSETQNSIWDSDVLSTLAGTKSNKEKTDEEKEGRAEKRRNIRQESLDNLTEALTQTDTRKAADVTSLSDFNSSNYRKSPSNNLSIFDTEIFDNMPEKTAGEEMAERARAEKEKDDSWRNSSGTLKSKNIVNRLFDQLMKDE